MVYAYFIANTTNSEYIDNSPLFQCIQKLKLHEDYLYIDELKEKREIQKLFKKLRPGDKLVVRSYRDMGISISQTLRVLHWLAENKVSLYSINESYYKNERFEELVADLMAMDEYYKERSRTEGFDEAKQSGKVGRPKSKRIEEAIKLYEKRNMSASHIKAVTGVSKSTLYRTLKNRGIHK